MLAIIFISIVYSVTITSIFGHSQPECDEPAVPKVEFDPCPSSRDLKCLGYVSTLFINELSKGFSPLNIEPMDPFHRNRVETNVEFGMTVNYINFTMSGFKHANIEVTKFEMNKISVEKITFDFNADSDIQFQSTKNCAKNYNGKYHSQGTAELIMPIRFNTIRDKSTGEELFDIKPATGIECEIKDWPAPKFQLNKELEEALDDETDKDVQEYIQKRKEDEIRVFKEEICIIMKKAIATVLVPGIQKTNQYVPVSAFLKLDDNKQCES